jgi:DNA-binding transcriptional ArsR family regulator
MVEKIRAVQNPLTVIAIFAALAEVAGTVALATVDKDLQHTFVWFVMAFPTCLVLLFFATLNFNPKVLYAPSDFQDEGNFLSTLTGGREMSVKFEDLGRQLEVAKQQILAEAVERVGAAGASEGQRLADIVTKQIELLREKVESTKESALESTREVIRCAYCSLVQFRSPDSRCRRCLRAIEDDTESNWAGLRVYPRSALQERIITFLQGREEPMTLNELYDVLGMSQSAIARSVEKLQTRGLVETYADDKGQLRVRSLE